MEVAEAVAGAGAEAVTLINTLKAMVIDVGSGGPGAGFGCGWRRALGPGHPPGGRADGLRRTRGPADLPIVGVGGVPRGTDAVEMLMAGAYAVQVGTASFADPRSAGIVRSRSGTLVLGATAYRGSSDRKAWHMG